MVLALSVGLTVLRAQESQSKSAAKSVTVTGCLQKGDKPGEYILTAEDAKRYGLQSKSVDLSKHVGHKVPVTGTKMRGANEENEAGRREVADLRVTNIKHISETCQ
jgi:hypothetical protein